MSDNVTQEVQMEWMEWDDWLDFGAAAYAGDAAGAGFPKSNLPAHQEHSSRAFATAGQNDCTRFMPAQQTLQHSHHVTDDVDDLLTGTGLLYLSNEDKLKPRGIVKAEVVKIEEDVSSQDVAALDWRNGYNCTEPQSIANDHECPTEFCGKHFKRRADLARHINAKHDRTVLYLCPVKGCFKKQDRRSFTRIDKLKAHLTAVHGGDDAVDCPVEGCSSDRLRLAGLLAHLANAHGSPRSSKISSALARWYCPVRPCNRGHGQGNLWRHVHEHLQRGDATALLAATNALRAESLVPIRAQCSHVSISGHHCSSSITSIQIICPACSALCDDDVTFELHMEQYHLVDATQVEHMDIWRQYCKADH